MLLAPNADEVRNPKDKGESNSVFIALGEL